MKRATFLFLLAAVLIPLSTAQLYPVDLKKGTYVQSPPNASELAVTINLLGEKGDVFRPGKEIRFSFQTTKDAYVIIYNIDSEGYVNLLWPDDGRPVISEGRKSYFLPDPAIDVHWETGDKTGVEYVHALAVPTAERINEDELYFLAGNERLSNQKRFQIDLDPFLAFNSIDEELVTGAEQTPPATDYTYFYINKRVEYPRYLCSKCHTPEKLPDPYAMECPEVVIEKVQYAEEPHYPYPPLFDVRHVGEKTNEEGDYNSERYGERWLDEDNGAGYRDDGGSDDTHLYLSFGLGSYGYPYQTYWPYYQPFFPGYYWDPFWWDFGWNMYWGDYWPGFGWGYPSYFYWRYPFFWHSWDGCGFEWAGCDRHYRPIMAGRDHGKRFIDYQRTNADLHKTRTLADSRLMRTRTGEAGRRFAASSLRQRVMKRGLRGGELVRPERGLARNRETERRIIYGGDRVRRETGRSMDRSPRSRSAERSRGAVGTRRTGSGRPPESRVAPQTRENPTRERRSEPGRQSVQRSAPERRSSDSGRVDSPRSRSSDSSTHERSRSGGGSRSRSR